METPCYSSAPRIPDSRFQIPRAPEEEIPESGVKTSEGFRTWNLESGIWNLLITERLHWRLPAGLEGRVEREDEPKETREQEGPEEALRVHVKGDLENGCDDLGERDPDCEPEHRAETREEHRLRHELLEDFPAGGADRHLDAHLAHALFQRGELDVDVDHAAANQRHDPGQHEDDVVDLPLASALPHPRGDVVDAEVLLEPVRSLQGRREPFGEVLYYVHVRDLEDDA